jgi:hypothetical protein
LQKIVDEWIEQYKADCPCSQIDLFSRFAMGQSQGTPGKHFILIYLKPLNLVHVSCPFQGLLLTLTQSSYTPVVIMVEPERILVEEIKVVPT